MVSRQRGAVVSSTDKFIEDLNYAMKAQVKLLKAEVMALKSENERLRNAGEKMFGYVGKTPEHSGHVDKHEKSKKAWRAAKGTES